MFSGVTKGGRGGQLPPGVADEGDPKQPQQKYFSNHKSKFDKVC